MRMHCRQSVLGCEIYDLFPVTNKEPYSHNDTSFRASFDRSLKRRFQKIVVAFHPQSLNLHPQRAGGRPHFFQVGLTIRVQSGAGRKVGNQ